MCGQFNWLVAMCSSVSPSTSVRPSLIPSPARTVSRSCIERVQLVIKRVQQDLQRKLLNPRQQDFQLLSPQELTQDPVPTLTRFQKDDKELTGLYLALAQSLAKKGAYAEALDRYSDALQYTESSENYAHIPAMYVQLREMEKARLSRLYLSLYQIQEEKVDAALETLEECSPKELQLDPLLAVLALQSNPTPENIEQTVMIAQKQTEDADKKFIYTQIVTLFPDHLSAYEGLIPLVKEFSKKNDLLFKAADLAKKANLLELAHQFLSQAVITSEMWETAKTLKLPPYPEELTQFLAEDCAIWKGRKRHETHIVIPLFPNVSIDGQDPVPLTLDSLLKLADRSYANGTTVKSEFIPTQIPAEGRFCYAVITHDIIPESQIKTYEDQEKALPEGYEPPRILDATMAILWDFLRSGTPSYGKNLGTFTHCQETTAQGSHFCVTGNQMVGLSIQEVSEARQSSSKMAIGMAGWKTF